MSAYNLTKKSDRQALRTERAAELQAALDGQWPRDVNDALRWAGPGRYNLTPAEYAARMCRSEIEYLDGVERRIAEGDPDLQGWEG